MSGGRSRQKAAKTILPPSWNGEGAFVQGGRCVLAERSGRRDPLTWAAHPAVLAVAVAEVN